VTRQQSAESSYILQEPTTQEKAESSTLLHRMAQNKQVGQQAVLLDTK